MADPMDMTAIRNDDADGANAFMSYRDNASSQSAAAELEAMLAAEEPVPAPVTAAPAPVEAPELTAKTVAADVARGVTEIPRAVVTGVRDAAQETINLFGDIGDWAENQLKTGGFEISLRGVKPISYEELRTLRAQGRDVSTQVQLKPLTGDIGDPESTTGKAVKSVSQFVAGFVGANKALKALKPATRTGRAAKAAGTGAVVDFTVFDPQEERLSNLVQEVPALQNPVTDFLAADPKDSNAEGRFKNAIEGLGIGVAVDGLLLGLKTLRQARIAKLKQEEVAKAREIAGVVEQRPKVETSEFQILGSDTPEAPLVGVAKAEPKPAEAVTEVAEEVRPGVQPLQLKTARAAKATAEVKPEDIMIVDEGVPGAAVPRGTKAGEVYVNFARINAPEDVQTVLQTMADKFKPSVETAARGVRTFEEIKLSAEQVNAWDVLKARRKGEPLSAEQSVAARQLWATSGDKLTQVAREASTNPSEANLFAFRKMLATHYAIQNEVLAARTETARALASWRIPAGSAAERFRDISQAIESNGGAVVTRDMADRVAKLAGAGMYQELDKFVQRGVWARTRDAMTEAWIMGLLSGPKTHIVNIMSNTSVIFMQMYERKVASVVSQILGNNGGVQAGEAMSQWFGLTQSWKDALRYAAKAAKTGETGMGMGKIELPQTAAISSDAFNLSSETFVGRSVDTIGNIIRLPGKALAAEDEFFKTIGYRMELNAQALRQAASEVHSGLIKAEDLKGRVADLLENPPENLRMSAVDQALYQTFTNSPGKLAQTLQSLTFTYPALKVILPFVRTPANILRYTFERTPLAPLMSQVRADISAGGVRQELALARMATGTALMMVAADMAMSGVVSGSGPKDARERQALERTGWQRNSIKIGGRWYAYNRLDPLGSLLGLSAEMVEILNNSDDEDTTESVTEAAVAAAASISATVMSKTYLSGLADLFEAISDPKRYTESFVQRLVGSIVPAVVGEVTRTVDPYSREVFNMLDAIKRRTPGLSDDLPMRRDLWGRPVKYQSGLGWAYDVFSPIYSKRDNPEPIDSEMLRLEKSVSMPGKKATFRGVNVDLNNYPGAYSRYVELAGNELLHPEYGLGAKDLLNQVVSGEHYLSDIYNQGTDGADGTKADMIDAIITDYRRLAREQVLEEFPEINDEIEDFYQKQQDILAGIEGQ